jgi:glutathione synthase/RimK-type ligase-like ATP-grasp enzyme
MTTTTLVPRGGRLEELADPSAAARGREPRVWVLTDRRYLAQRMPAAVGAWLGAHGHEPEIVVADDGDALGCVTPVADQLVASTWSQLAAGDVVIARSRDPLALALLEEAETRGARTIDRAHAIDRVRNKAMCTLALARRGLPVPNTLLARRPEDLDQLPDSAFPLVVKPVLGDNARGVQIVATRDQLAAIDWPHDLLIAQTYIDAGGFDIKLYVVGDRVWATRRPSPLAHSDDPGALVPVTSELRELADGCREEFGLQLFGVDVLVSAAGMGIVDVNEFPNYTGVDEAPAAIGSLLLTELRRQARAA